MDDKTIREVFNMKAQEKQVMVEYFNEAAYMYDWLEKHPEYKMVDYKFTFSYGYILYYMEK